MIPAACKRLAEVDFPIAEVSRHAAREKPIVHNHPQSFHYWWARRPLASARAVLLSLLLPDPCEPHCHDDFKSYAKEDLLGMTGRDYYWPYVVTNCPASPQLQEPVRDPASFPWHEVTKVQHYWLERECHDQAHAGAGG